MASLAGDMAALGGSQLKLITCPRFDASSGALGSVSHNANL